MTEKENNGEKKWTVYDIIDIIFSRKFKLAPKKKNEL